MRTQLKLILASLLLSAPVFASAAWYQVEVVVFELKHPESKDEKFPMQNIDEQAAKSRSLTEQGDARRDAFVALPATQYKLNDAIANMEKSGQYKVLYHSAWRQPSDANTSAVRIEKDHELLGTLTLNATGTPHINADILLRKPTDTETASNVQQPAETAFQNQNAIVAANTQMDNEIHYRLKQSQHFKVGELTYFDHPAFGMLVDVQAYDPKTGG